MVEISRRTLEEKGFLTRQEHETDTRAKNIWLTKKGNAVLQKAIIEIEHADLDFFATLDSKISSFNSTMVKLIEKNSA